MPEKNDFNPIPILLIGGGVVALFALLSRRRETPPIVPEGSRTVPGPLPVILPPSTYANLAEVRTRLDEVTTLFRAGRLSAEQTIQEAQGLEFAVLDMVAAGTVPVPEAQDVTRRIDLLTEDAGRYLSLNP